MTTASTNTTIANTSSATFQAWVQEIYTNLVTNCGLSQTADTGQMAVPCATSIPGTANTSAGYYVFEFNDTLNATAPIYIKLEFGTAAATTDPMMWITVGPTTNGAGTITGMTRVAACNGAAPASTVANYTSRYCYNATQGYVGAAFKVAGSSAAAYAAVGGFHVFRSVNSAGAPTGDSVMLLACSGTATGTTTSGTMQLYSYNLSAAYLNVSPVPSGGNWAYIPFTATSSLEGSSGQIFPVFQWAGSASVAGYGITNALALAISAEIPVGSTVATTILGSVPLTYISVAAGLGPTSFTEIDYSGSTYTLLMLWE